MPSKTPIIAWARSPVAPIGSALARLSPHELGRPLLLSLLQQSGLPAHAVDAVVVGNALGAGGNPARMLALAAGLPDGCAAHTIDTQCCSGLDAVAMAVGLLQSGQAEVVIAGGIEAWSRAPIRQTRPLHPGEQPQGYERPPFAPDPARDPDMLQSAADYALAHGFSRSQQEQYALLSHSRALAAQAQLAPEIVPWQGLRPTPIRVPSSPGVPRACRWWPGRSQAPVRRYRRPCAQRADHLGQGRWRGPAVAGHARGLRPLESAATRTMAGQRQRGRCARNTAAGRHCGSADGAGPRQPCAGRVAQVAVAGPGSFGHRTA
jgi:hypothetical protein